MLTFSAMDDNTAHKTGHLILPKYPIQKILGQFVYKTSNFSLQKNILVEL